MDSLEPPPPARPEGIGSRVVLRRSYKILALVAAVVLGAILIAAFAVPLPTQDWYSQTIAASASTVSVAQGADGSLQVAYTPGSVNDPLV